MKRTPIVLLLALLAACSKDARQDQTSSRATSTTQKFVATETAYPNIHGETVGVKNGADSVYFEKKGDDIYVLDGDIVYTRAMVDTLEQQSQRKTEGTFTETPSYLWPGGVVYYVIEPGFTAAELTYISQAMQAWSSNCPVSFVARSSQANYVYIVPGASGSGLFSAYVGMHGGGQEINLEEGAFLAGEVMHELGHALGLYHEQCRTDRANAILVNYNNVYPNTTSNVYQFETYTQQGLAGSQIGPFDFNSIMMYGSYDFSDGIHPVITTLSGGVFYANRTNLSTGDIQTVDYMYGRAPGVYARMEYDVLSVQNDGYTDYENDEIYIRFYSNAACTVPATLAANETVTFQIEDVLQQYAESVSPVSTSINNYTVVGASGTNSIDMGNYDVRNLTNDYGYLRGQTESLSLNAGVGYTVE